MIFPVLALITLAAAGAAEEAPVRRRRKRRKKTVEVKKPATKPKQVKRKRRRGLTRAERNKLADLADALKLALKKKRKRIAKAPSARAALRELRDYLKGGGHFGNRKRPSKAVAVAQRRLGIKDDGIVGKVTRAKALALGVTLPARPKRKRLKRTTTTTRRKRREVVFREDEVEPVTARPKKQKPTKASAARRLKAYLVKGGNMGTKARRSTEVARAQKVFGITADGIYGKQTRREAKAQGVSIPSRRRLRR